MNKKYTKKQITEAIAYWKKQLKRLNESENRLDTVPATVGEMIEFLKQFDPTMTLTMGLLDKSEYDKHIVSLRPEFKNMWTDALWDNKDNGDDLLIAFC